MTSVTTRTIDAAIEDVFDALEDPAIYGYIIIGTKRIRFAEPGWPAVGSAFHTTIGPGPFVLHDHSEVDARDAPFFLALHVGVGPLGSAQAEFRLSRKGTATLVTLTEFPRSGVLTAIPRRLADPIIGWRNAWSLARLESVVHARSKAPQPKPTRPKETTR